MKKQIDSLRFIYHRCGRSLGFVVFAQSGLSVRGPSPPLAGGRFSDVAGGVICPWRLYDSDGKPITFRNAGRCRMRTAQWDGGRLHGLCV